MTEPNAAPASSAATRSTGYGIGALVYSLGVVAYEIAFVVAASVAGGMDYSALEALMPGFPFVLISGIVVCTVVSRFAPRGRVFSIIGGVLMILPLGGLMIADAVANA